MHLSLTFLTVVVIFLIIISAFFSAAEIGVMSLNRYRLRHLVKNKHKAAIRVNKMLTHPERMLSVILIGNTLCNIFAAMAATLIGQTLYGESGMVVATAILTLAILIFSEMTPKTFAALYPQKVAFLSSLPLYYLQKIFLPFVNLISWIANNLIKMCGVSIDKAQRDALSGEELRSVVHEAGSFMPIEHKGMLLSLIDLEQATVEDIMVPKSEIIGIDIDEPWAKILEQLETIQHTRVPIYRGSIENLVGLIHLRKVLNLLLDKELDLEQLINIAEQPYYIPEATPLNVQIINFQNMKRRSCFVVNEYGELQGLVTMEDILEEIVGEFTTDISDMSKDVLKVGDKNFIIDGSITIRNLNRMLNWQFPSIGPRTLSGVIIEHLGYIPPADCCLKINNFYIEILKIADNTIKSLKVSMVN
ncbi:MAG: magnesium/cobalt efflux protein [Legionellales bacterium RIFCSPHIGHO2_12_FULL_35_11]|nr:MAG: magnesium/cobalt efflux protein [Legionellales bacterium RIFCSPHIGHO2_12_FULL_35_11]